MKNRKDMSGMTLNWKRIGLSLGISVLVTLTLTVAVAAMVDREMMNRSWMNYLAALILVLSAFTGSLTAGGGAERWIGQAVVGAAYWLILLAINALAYEGNLSGAGATALAILGGSGAAMLLGRGGKRRSHSRRRYRNR